MTWDRSWNVKKVSIDLLPWFLVAWPTWQTMQGQSVLNRASSDTSKSMNLDSFGSVRAISSPDSSLLLSLFWVHMSCFDA